MSFPLWPLIAAFLAPSVPFALLAVTLWGLAPLVRRKPAPGILAGGDLPRAVARPRAEDLELRSTWTYVRIAVGLALTLAWVIVIYGALARL